MKLLTSFKTAEEVVKRFKSGKKVIRHCKDGTTERLIKVERIKGSKYVVRVQGTRRSSRGEAHVFCLTKGYQIAPEKL